MHEMSLAEGILQIVEDAASAQGFRRVTEVRLEIGALSGVEVEALAFCLDVVLKGSVADGARVELERLPGQGWCLGCGGAVEIQALYDACPRCGSYQVQATGGTQMRVKDLLVE
ncbi:MAG TPA: hydrogenase maturation nickel metallochaperone HypA [Thiobacillaceae bacterium]|nr:hydrogenase maturation nickel metallochaperone HypA [Thiobacillaceae bacterium]HNU63318.1 hydrogenase maturation nickel metallochaperone HypA [Thiobacillaceae bacterium]